MKKLKKALTVVFIIILLCILLINISIIIQTKKSDNMVPSVFGYKPFVVLSGSMESNIKVGDLVIVKEVDTNSLQKGDIIAFKDSENVVTTHRIVEVLKENNKLCFITKGDANNTNDDGVVYESQIEGKYQFRIGKLGNAILFIQEPVGFVVVLMSIFIICMLYYFFQNRKIDKETKFKDEEERKAFEEFMKTREEKK